MIKSMTGFGRGIGSDDTKKITVEIKSVNHRYLDINVRLPRKCNAFETEIRTFLKSKILRGKVDVYISLEETADTVCNIVYNRSVAAMYLKHLDQMAEDFGLVNDISVSVLSRYPDIFTVEEAEENTENLRQLLFQALEEAVVPFLSSRIAEGERLRADLLTKIQEMERCICTLKERSPQILAEYCGRLREKVRDLLEDQKIDEGRIAAEVTVYADKICIDEEMVRLESHVQETKTALESGSEVGRRLDFLAQEMNREANTILSKSTDVEIANIGIALKTLIEKVREQIQNIE